MVRPSLVEGAVPAVFAEPDTELPEGIPDGFTDGDEADGEAFDPAAPVYPGF